MTTIDDVDLFGEAFGGFRSVGVARRRHPAVLTVLALLAAAGVVGAGFVWARDNARGPVVEHVDARTLLPVLATAQGADDVVDRAEIGSLAVEPASTRFLAETDSGRHFAAISASGDLCVLTVPSGDLATLGCVRSVVGAQLASGDVWLAAEGGPAPAADDGWHEAGPNLWVRG
ncbi:hypothetical protein GXP71_19095 [Cellulomonas sp. H30R-01]|uniref:hypothetical protein n=1 Tax=Cellulomonas sp. H30R-01 TaxID=2704467 RepID=UPI00138D4EB1|nr:hypothetical protein [Cellulomonas sp. H30R-01]QHT57978.1 hypothetical protein GXP71_19095 [Cellulomonas sp. H30R-01]